MFNPEKGVLCYIFLKAIYFIVYPRKSALGEASRELFKQEISSFFLSFGANLACLDPIQISSPDPDPLKQLKTGPNPHFETLFLMRCLTNPEWSIPNPVPTFKEIPSPTREQRSQNKFEFVFACEGTVLFSMTSSWVISFKEVRTRKPEIPRIQIYKRATPVQRELKLIWFLRLGFYTGQHASPEGRGRCTHKINLVGWQWAAGSGSPLKRSMRIQKHCL